MVPTVRIRKYVPRRRIQHCACLSAYLRMYAFPTELGCYNYRGKLHRQDTTLYGDGGPEYGHRYLAADFTYTDGGQAADA